MSCLVQFENHQDIAVLAINNPPLNELSTETCNALQAAMERAENDASIRAIVIIGAGNTFAAGVGVGKFLSNSSGLAKRVPALLPFCEWIEDRKKPVVAAIHGFALGSGLELAMAAHYRIALPDAQMGENEARLGLIPCGGGSQRLPRLVGVEAAVRMCLDGSLIKGRDALQLGMVDRIIEGDLLIGAIAFARECTDKPATKTRDRNEKLGTPEQNDSIFAAVREGLRKKHHVPNAALAAIDAIEAATKLPFADGCKVEQERYQECLVSDQSKALIHALLAEQELRNIPGIPNETMAAPIRSAAVVGAGTMGGAIAMVFANAGIPVFIKDVDQAALDCGWSIIQKNYANSIKRGRFTQDFANERMELIRPTLSYADFASVDIVVEAVFEGMAFKKQVFAELDRVCKPGAIMATNTSYLDIDEIASATSRPRSVLGMHFFSPANVMKLLEVVRARATSDEVIRTCMSLAKDLGKIGVLAGNCRGFIGNRMFALYRREAQFLVEEGADPRAVDEALQQFGMAMGPLAVADLAGLDISWRMRNEFRHLQAPGVRQPLAEDLLCEIGRYGQKTGAGWYKYGPDRRAVDDPDVAAMIHKRAAEAGISRHPISAEEIVERCIYIMVNEGARILEDGIAIRASDIDVVYLNGYGFPRHRGGPMWYADAIGLKKVYERICHFHQRHGELWRPAPLLTQLAQKGKSFADLRGASAAFCQ